MAGKRTMCIGGPKHGQTVAILHGSRFLDASTGAIYIRAEGGWVYQRHLAVGEKF